MAAVIPLYALQPDIEDPALPSASEVALTDGAGRILVASDPAAFRLADGGDVSGWVARARDEGTAVFAAVAVWQLSRGPVSLGFLTPFVEDSLSGGPDGVQVRLHDVGREHVGALPVALGQLQDARQRARHLHDGHAMGASGLAGVLQQHDDVERLVEQHRERVRRVHRGRRQDGKDLAAEQPLQVLDLVGRQVVLFVDHHVLGEKFLAQLLPVVLLLEMEMLRQRRNLLELLGRRQPVGAAAR